MIPSTAEPLPPLATLENLRTLNSIFMRWSSISGCVRKLPPFLKALHAWLHAVVTGYFSHFCLFPDSRHALASELRPSIVLKNAILNPESPL